MWSTPSLPLLPGTLGPRVIIPDRVRRGSINLGVQAMKRYSTVPRSPEPEPHERMQFSIILKGPFCYRGWGVLRWIQLVYSKPYQENEQFILIPDYLAAIKIWSKRHQLKPHPRVDRFSSAGAPRAHLIEKSTPSLRERYQVYVEDLRFG